MEICKEAKRVCNGISAVSEKIWRYASKMEICKQVEICKQHSAVFQIAKLIIF